MEKVGSLDVVDKVAMKLGIAVEQLKPLGEILVNEYRSSEIIYAIAHGLLIIVGAVAIYFGIRHGRKLLKSEDVDTEPYGIILSIGCVIGIALLIGFFCSMVNNIASALNPHYHILKDLLG